MTTSSGCRPTQGPNSTNSPLPTSTTTRPTTSTLGCNLSGSSTPLRMLTVAGTLMAFRQSLQPPRDLTIHDTRPMQNAWKCPRRNASAPQAHPNATPDVATLTAHHQQPRAPASISLQVVRLPSPTPRATTLHAVTLHKWRDPAWHFTYTTHCRITVGTPFNEAWQLMPRHTHPPPSPLYHTRTSCLKRRPRLPPQAHKPRVSSEARGPCATSWTTATSRHRWPLGKAPIPRRRLSMPTPPPPSPRRGSRSRAMAHPAIAASSQIVASRPTRPPAIVLRFMDTACLRSAHTSLWGAGALLVCPFSAPPPEPAPRGEGATEPSPPKVLRKRGSPACFCRLPTALPDAPPRICAACLSLVRRLFASPGHRACPGASHRLSDPEPLSRPPAAALRACAPSAGLGTCCSPGIARAPALALARTLCASREMLSSLA